MPRDRPKPSRRRWWSREAPDPTTSIPRLARVPNDSQQPIRLIIDAGAEQQVVAATGHAVAEAQAPEAVDGDRTAVGPAQVAQPPAGLEVVRVDAAVTEVADQQRTAEAAEVRRCPHQTPGRVQRAVAGEAGDHAAVLRVDVDEAESGAVGLVALSGLVLGVRDHDPASDRLDAERRVVARQRG